MSDLKARDIRIVYREEWDNPTGGEAWGIAPIGDRAVMLIGGVEYAMTVERCNIEFVAGDDE